MLYDFLLSDLEIRVKIMALLRDSVMLESEMRRDFVRKASLAIKLGVVKNITSMVLPPAVFGTVQLHSVIN